MSKECLYFKALVERKKIVLFVALLRSLEDHMVFDRACDPKNGIFEFFVPAGYESRFVEIMQLLRKKELISSWEKI